MSVILPPTPTKNIGRLLNYGHSGEAHHGDGPRAIFESGYLCSPETAQAEMMATLRDYGKLDGDFVQGLHVIDSYGFDEVDPNDDSIDEQGRDVWARLEEKFEESFEKARLMFPGNQISSYGQIDGASGKFHVHHVVCAVVKETALYPGIVTKRGKEPVSTTFTAGRSLNGELRNIARLRRVNDAWMKEHLGVDNKARMKSPKDRVSIREVEAKVDGEKHWRETLKERIREVSAHAESLDEFIEQLAALDVEARPSNRGGRAGISYAITWSDDEGVEHVDKAVTAGRTGIGADYGRAALDLAFENNRARRREHEIIVRFDEAVAEHEKTKIVAPVVPSWLTNARLGYQMAIESIERDIARYEDYLDNERDAEAHAWYTHLLELAQADNASFEEKVERGDADAETFAATRMKRRMAWDTPREREAFGDAWRADRRENTHEAPEVAVAPAITANTVDDVQLRQEQSQKIHDWRTARLDELDELDDDLALAAKPVESARTSLKLASVSDAMVVHEDERLLIEAFDETQAHRGDVAGDLATFDGLMRPDVVDRTALLDLVEHHGQKMRAGALRRYESRKPSDETRRLNERLGTETREPTHPDHMPPLRDMVKPTGGSSSRRALVADRKAKRHAEQTRQALHPNLG